MSYLEILKFFGFEIENMSRKEDYSDTITLELLNSYNEFYIKASKNYQNLNNYISSSNNDLFKEASSYALSSSLLFDELENKNKELDKELETKNDIERDKLNLEIAKYNTTKDDLKEQLIKFNNNILENINELENKTQELNEFIDSNIEPINKNYNKYINEFNNKADSSYSFEHSKLSKLSYTAQSDATSLENTLQEQNKETLNEINSLKVDIENNKTKLRQEILALEVKLNDKIRSLDQETKNMKEQNSIQAEIEKDQYRKKIQELENKSLERIKQINNEAKDSLIRLDGNYTNKIKYIDRKIEEKSEEIHKKLLIYKNEYSLLLEEFKREYSTYNILEKHQKRLELKAKAKKIKIFEKSSELEILKLNQEKLKLQSKNKLERDLIEAKRKYNFSLEDLKEKKEKQPYLNNLKEIDEEKKSYDKILENRLTIQSNKEKVFVEILKLNKNVNFNIFENRKQKSINEKSFKSYTLNEEISLNQKNLKLDLEANEQKDKYAKRYYESTALLEIEKNKHLTSLNEERIKFNKDTNNLYLNYITNNRNLHLDKYKELIKEFSRFNDEYIKISQNMCSSSIQYNHTKNSDLKTINEVNTKIDISKKSYILQTVKKAQFLDSLTKETQVFIQIIQDYLRLIAKFCSNFISYSKSENIVSFVKLSSNTLNKLIDRYSSNISNIVNQYIYYNSLNLSRRLVDSLNYTYSQKIESLNSKINEYDINIKSLNKTNNQYFTKINDLTLQNKQLNYNQSEVKESKSTILNNESKISTLKTRIKSNNNKINYYIELKEKDNKKLLDLKNELESKTSKLTQIEDKDSIYSKAYIEKISELISTYKKLDNHFANLDDSLDYNKVEKKINKYLTEFSLKLNLINKDYFVKINNTLNKIKEYNEKNYTQDVLQANNQFSLGELNNRKLNDKYNTILFESKENHIDLKTKIINEYEKKFSNLKDQYDIDYNKLKSQSDKMVSHYFDLFNSCEKLINIQNNLYNSNLESTNKEVENTKLNNKKAYETNKNKNLNKVNNDNSNISYDISIMPKLKRADERNLTSKNNLDNKQLNLNIDNINKELKLYKKQLKQELNLLNKETKNNTKLVIKNYNEQTFKLRKQYYNSLKKIYKMKYQDLKSGTNN